jgi:hypothetical protein
MDDTSNRTVAVLWQAIAVCRGALYSARSGDASVSFIDRILDGTSGETLRTLIGEDAFQNAMAQAEALPPEDRDILLSIKDEPY